jgi:hypothetical protein
MVSFQRAYMNLGTPGPELVLIPLAQAQPTKLAPVSGLVMSFVDSTSEQKMAMLLRRLR